MNTKIVICEKHGEYTLTEIPNPMAALFDDLKISKTTWSGYCLKCSQERAEKEIMEESERVKSNLEARRRNAGISLRNMNKTFDDYVCDDGAKQQQAKSKFIALSKDVLEGKGFNLIAAGGVGTGKTLLACALVDSICDHKRCELIKVIDLIREFKATWAKCSENTEIDLINYYSKLDLLIIDEIGVQFGSDTERLFIFDVIDGRYQNMKPTVLISNLSIELIKESIGERVIDRLRDDGGQLVVFDWKSCRGEK